MNEFSIAQSSVYGATAPPPPPMYDDDDDDASPFAGCLECFSCRNRKDLRLKCTRVVLLVFAAFLVVTFVLVVVSVSQSGAVWRAYKYDQHVRVYSLMQSSTTLDAPSVVPYGVGMIRFDSKQRTVTIDAIVFGLANRTGLHIYGPLEAGSTRADVAIALRDEDASSDHIHITVPVVASADIERIYHRPPFYYVGISTLRHRHGDALRWTLGIECDQQDKQFG